MKKIIYLMLGLVLVTGGFTSCSDDDDDNGSVSMPANPEKEIAGTYIGTWTKTAVSNGKTTTEENKTITLTASDSAAYIGTIAVEAFLDIKAMSSVMNVTWNSNNVYKFFNYSGSNGFSSVVTDLLYFSGSVTDADGAKTLNFSFTHTARSGRATADYTYSFVGTMQ